MRNAIAILIFIVGILLAIYVGGWVLFIKPIMVACAAFDAGTLTASLVGMTVIKCLIATTVAGFIIFVSSTISAFLLK